MLDQIKLPAVMKKKTRQSTETFIKQKQKNLVIA